MTDPHGGLVPAQNDQLALPVDVDVVASVEQPVVAITGHRPARITDEARVREELYQTLLSLRPRLLIQGMADGVDLWSAAAAWKAGVPYHAVLPWAGHRAGPKIARDWVLEHAVETTVLDDSLTYPGPWAFGDRNRWMVDRADVLLAVWDGKRSGGTYHAVSYAKRLGVKIIRLQP